MIEEGVESVKCVFVNHFVRRDESLKMLSLLRQRGSYTVIVRLFLFRVKKKGRSHKSLIFRISLT